MKPLATAPEPVSDSVFGDHVSAAFERMARGDAAVWIHLRSREEIRDLPVRPGPLAGRLLAVKDNIDVAGLPTTAACPDFAYTPEASAPCVEQLEAAGAVVAGKTNMDQFATGLVGTRSPYGSLSCAADPTVIAGGSSSGSAVAVALGMVDIALGTDTAGSGRVPASLNGVVGLKPTRGLVSTVGVVPACRTLDCVSVFARTCAEAGTVLGVAMDGSGPRAGGQVGVLAPRLARPRVGVPRSDQLEFFGDPQAEECFGRAVALLEGIGCSLVEVDIAPMLAAGGLLYDGPWVAERAAAVGDFIRSHPEARLDPLVRRIITDAQSVSGVSAFRGAYRLDQHIADAAAIWGVADVLALPTVGRAWTHEEVRADPMGVNSALGRYTNFANLMDLCAISVPAGTASGVPFGLQILAPALADDLLIALGSRFERAGEARTSVRLAVVGAHLSGQPLNHQLTERGARLAATTATSDRYRLYALAETTPPKPGLVRGDSGASIEVEVWELDEAAFGAFVAEVPAPLGIGTVELADGSSVNGFICEPTGLVGATEITEYGGWRPFLAAKAGVTSLA